LKALADLATVVEPDVCVLVIGDHEGMEFYREVTRGLGAADYLPKPLARDLVSRHFGGFVLGRAPSSSSSMGGRVLAVTGVRGGCGASSIATNLAWHFGVTLRHHTVLVDPDLYRGNAAFLLNLPPGDGLVAALESPLRIDTLLAERAAQPAAERLHVLAGESPVGVLPAYADDAAETLINALRKRYNFVVLDVPFAPVPLYRDLIGLAHQQVLVMEPSLVSLRDVLRFNTVSSSDGPAPLIVLNRLGIPGGLTRRQVEEGLKRKVDIVLPDLPRQLRGAANLGEPAVVAIAAYRKVISELGRAVAGAGLLDSLAASAPPEPAAKRKKWFRARKTK
jgi:pilus assembly protein CpaE